jgi:predicted MPP superfamily phosphohydrolase
VQPIHVLTAIAHLLPALALRTALPWSWAVPLALGLWLCTAARLSLLVRDRRRPSWRVRLVDEPIFWHWGNTAYGLILFAPTAAVLGGAQLLGLIDAGAEPDGWTGSVARAARLCYLLAAPVSAWSLWGIRRLVRARRAEIPIDGLDSAFDGYRVVQLSDLHIGSFDSKSAGLRWSKLANALRPDLCTVTGDLVTSGAAFYEDAAEVVAQLRARDGVFVCMGNHDQHDSERLTAELRHRGVQVLRNQHHSVWRGSARLIVAGLDDRFTQQDDMERTLAGRPPDAPTILLAHYPSSGPEAASRGVQLVLSGHTHGGQFGVPLAGARLNLGRLLGQPRQGLHRTGSGWQYISAGLGTTGPPLRLGVVPEIGLLVLRARPANMS